MTNTSTPDLRAALIEARDWFESQAKAVSKGCGSSYELHDLRAQRDALDAALAAPAQAAVKPDMLVNGGALKLVLNVLRRAGKNEVADELECTAQAAPVDAAQRKDVPWRGWKRGDLLRVTSTDKCDPFVVMDLVIHDDFSGDRCPFVAKGGVRFAMDAERQLEFVAPAHDAARAAQEGK